MTQKFFRGHRVLIGTNEAIIVGSYSDLHTSLPEITPTYALLILKPGRPYGSWHAWFEEKDLTLCDGTRDEGEALLQRYKERP